MAAVGASLLSTLRSILVCPLCKGDLDVAAGTIACRTGHLRVEQTRPDCVDLLPREMGVADLERWSERLAAMTQWYRDLLATPADAAACFNHAVEPSAVVAEAARVLRPGGLLLLVLEMRRRESAVR